jgi:hypothetical protein
MSNGDQLLHAMLRAHNGNYAERRRPPRSMREVLHSDGHYEVVRRLHIFDHGQEAFFDKAFFNQARSRQISEQQILREANHNGSVQGHGWREAIPRI